MVASSRDKVTMGKIVSRKPESVTANIDAEFMSRISDIAKMTGVILFLILVLPLLSILSAILIFNFL